MTRGFASYLALNLSALVLGPATFRRFRRLVQYLAQLMAGNGDAAQITNRAEALHAELADCRAVERMWEATRSMVDDRYGQSWHGASHYKQRRNLGLSRVGDSVLVTLARSSSSHVDLVDEAVRRDGFQRACALLARKIEYVVAGQVGEHGVVFLSSANGSRKSAECKVVPPQHEYPGFDQGVRAPNERTHARHPNGPDRDPAPGRRVALRRAVRRATKRPRSTRRSHSKSKVAIRDLPI